MRHRFLRNSKIELEPHVCSRRTCFGRRMGDFVQCVPSEGFGSALYRAEHVSIHSPITNAQPKNTPEVKS